MRINMMIVIVFNNNGATAFTWITIGCSIKNILAIETTPAIL